MNEQEQIEACYQEMYRGMIAKDRQILESVLDDAFVLVHMTGMQQDKAAYIRAIEAGVLNYYTAEHQNLIVRQHGDRAGLVGQSRVSAAVFGGGRHTWRLQLHCKLAKTAGVWKVTGAKASTY